MVLGGMGVGELLRVKDTLKKACRGNSLVVH